MQIAYLGPAGSYHSFVADAIARALDATHVPVADAHALVADVESGIVDYGVLAVETNLCGTIEPHFRAILDSAVTVCGEFVFAAPMVLATSDPDRPLDHVHSHPEAVAECRQWLARNLPGAEISYTASTAAGARDAAAAGSGHAAICAPEAATAFGLTIIVPDVCDAPGDQTRFWVFGRSNHLPFISTRGTFLVTPSDDRLECLVRALGRLTAPLVHVDSVTLRKDLGQYQIRIDLAGDDETLTAAREALAEAGDVRVVGHYTDLTPVCALEGS